MYFFVLKKIILNYIFFITTNKYNYRSNYWLDLSKPALSYYKRPYTYIN